MPSWKTNTLIFLQYNNYYNRMLKREENLTDYLDYELIRLSATNFNPNDGINTEHIVNMSDGLHPDYMIAIDEANQIVSRWYVIEIQRIRGGQQKIFLHRDTVADYYEDITTAPCFIEKATLDSEDPLVFNEEDMTFNQIKTRETFLKDKTKCPWIVGYYSKTLNDESILKNVDIDYNLPIDIPYISVDAFTIETWKYFQYNANNPLRAPIKDGKYSIHASENPPKLLQSPVFNIDVFSGEVDYSTAAFNNTSIYVRKGLSTTQIKSTLKQSVDNFTVSSLRSLLDQYLTNNVSQSDFDDFLNFNGKTIKTGDGSLYDITIVPVEDLKEKTNLASGTSLANALTIIVDNSQSFTGVPNNNSYSIEITSPRYALSYKRRENLTLQYDMSGVKLTTEDAPYNIFAIPYGTVLVFDRSSGSVEVTNTEKEIGMAAAATIVRKFGSNLYDIQLLPYCPLVDIYSAGNGSITVNNTKEFSPIINTAEDYIAGYIFHAPKAKFTINIPYTIEKPITAVDKKISNQCDKYRLCSPNFNGYFDFSVAKNGGIQYFNVDCTYKPFQPYIHINPNFGGLYGQDFDDPRGLICGGDFSLPQIQDRWQEYQIQNKNFQESFDRQIENLEIQNKYQRIQDITTAIAGTAQGAVSGAGTGLMASGGNPYAALGGAIVGTVFSGAAGIADVMINQGLRNEAIDYTKDNFGYSLGNIQALPHTLTKVSSLNNNNKIFPILEYYTCTDREKEALRNKLTYNGMTVMTIGTIGQYIKEEPSYIKGQIIRLPELEGDFHMANEIAREINLGMYI